MCVYVRSADQWSTSALTPISKDFVVCSDFVMSADKSARKRSRKDIVGHLWEITEPPPKKAAHTLYSRPVKLDWKGLERPKAGLINLGNSCYMNSVVQALFQLPPFVDWLASERCANKRDDCVTCSFQQLLALMCEEEIVDPVNLHLLVTRIMPGKELSGFLDSSKYLIAILSKMHAEYIGGLSGNKIDFWSGLTSPLFQLFGVVIGVDCPCVHHAGGRCFLCKLCIECKECAGSVQEAWNLWFGRCSCTPVAKDSCLDHYSFDKKILKLPPLLIIKLKRFEEDGSKILQLVHINLDLDVCGTSYHLRSVLLHSGVDMARGFNSTVVKERDGSMYLHHDSTKKSVSVHSFLHSPLYKESAYVLIYEKSRVPVNLVKKDKVDPVLPTTSTLNWKIIPQKAPEKVPEVKVAVNKNKKAPKSLLRPRKLETPSSIKADQEPIQRDLNIPGRSSCSADVVLEDPIQINLKLPGSSPHHADAPLEEPIQKDLDSVGSGPSREVVLKDVHGDVKSKPVKGMQSIAVQVHVPGSILSYQVCKDMPQRKFHFFTGLSQTNFDALYNFLGGDEVIRSLKFKCNRATPHRKFLLSEVPHKDLLFITLLRLKRAFPIADLARLYHISSAQVSQIFNMMIRHMSLSFKHLEGAMFVSTKAQRTNKPACFKKIKNLRVILDVVEFKIQRYAKQGQEICTPSSYMCSDSVKFIIGISCHGAVIFISPGFGDSISDKDAVLQSGLLERFERGDCVMTKRQLKISRELSEVGVEIVEPPHNSGLKHLSSDWTRAIAKVHYYVEQVMGIIKQNRLLRQTIPRNLLPYVEDIIYTAACLVNFSTGPKRKTQNK